MKKVKEEIVADIYVQQQLLNRIDFSDAFSTTNTTNSVEEITQLIFNNSPKWVNQLFVLRNRLVKLIGLKTMKPANDNEKYKVGGYIGIFKIFSITDREIIVGANDSHLNFRAIIVNNQKPTYNIQVITLVEYNNLTGKIYMNIVKPFHRLIVKKLVLNAYNNDE